MRLERAQMLEVEGGTPEWCMKILRHEAGHAFDNAYELRRRRRRMRLFGRPSTPYPGLLPAAAVLARASCCTSTRWYAQSHPDEDFAETFAVWLTPDSDWRARYADWPALRKLEYMDDADARDRRQPPIVARAGGSSRSSSCARRCARTTRGSAAHYGVEHPHFYDRDLRRLFSTRRSISGNRKASRFITRVRRDVRRIVAEWTGEYQYTIDQVIEDMITRCQRAEPAPQDPEDRTQARLHDHRHRADDELPAQRTAPGGPVMQNAK